jgi:uncharacterized protein (DUF1697 family)
MTSFVALLRAVNVGRRQLAMDDLKGLAAEVGLQNARTYIASGNLLFSSVKSESAVARDLENRLKAHMGSDVPVLVRTAAELRDVVAANPFSGKPGAKVAVIFLDKKAPNDAIENATGIADERLALGAREIYVHYPNGMGRSKLRIPAAIGGTARNMNTVAKLAAMAMEVE